MKILIAGDFCPRDRVAEALDRGDFDKVLGGVKPIIEQADYSIVNFECPVCRGDEKPIEKLGPNLKCSEKGVEAVKWAGFECVTLANNHFLDFGKEGVEQTLETCRKHGIDTVGGGLNLQNASLVLYKEILGKTLAIINCCEHEFSIATESTAGSNPLNPVQQYYAIKEARKKSNYVMVVVHGGHEHYNLPSTRMQETYRFFIDAGADAVVNHHQHCYSGYEFYKDKPIIYGLGNFCFDEGRKDANLWHEGYMAELDFSETVGLKVFPYVQCEDEPTVELIQDKTQFDKDLDDLNVIIIDEKELKRIQNEYYVQSNMAARAMFDPVNLRYLKGCQRRGWLPFFYSRRYITKIFDYINCESHREKVIFNLKKYINSIYE